MTKGIIIFLIIAVVALVIIAVGQIVNTIDSGQAVSRPSSSPLPSLIEADSQSMIASAGGIDVAVEDVVKSQNQTIISLSLNNHQYDLTDFDVGEKSSLAGEQAVDYQVISEAMAGHHVQSEMIFDGQLSGPLEVVVGDLKFNFNIE